MPSGLTAMLRPRMKRRTLQRGFIDNVEPLLILTIVAVVVGVPLPIVKAAWNAGWSWWSVALIIPASFVLVVSYFPGMSYVIYSIAKLANRSDTQYEPGVWYSIVVAINLCTAPPVLILLGDIVVKWIAP